MRVAPRRERRRFVSASLSILVTAALASPLDAQRGPATDEQRARVDALFATYAQPGVPGATVAVARDGELLLAAAYGLADVAGGKAVTTTTLFRLASVSKQFTAAAVLTLIEAGKLSFDDRLGDLLPDVPKYALAVNVRQLLSHTSGVPDYEPLAGARDGPQIHDRDVLALIHKARRLYFEPGTSWRYSNTGYALLSLIVERVSGESFASYLRRRVFDRAGMRTAVAYQAGVDSIVDRAFGHSYISNTWRRTDQNRTSAVLGDGGIYASAEDLVRWSAALDDHAVVSKASFAEATTPVTPASGMAASYGYGWFLDTHRGVKRQRHEGDSIGFRTAIQRYPDQRLTVVVLVNRANAPIDALSDGVANIFLLP